MNILQINTTYNQGGAAKIAQLLCESLNKDSNFSSHFAYGRGNKVEDSRVFRFSLKTEVYIHGFLTRFSGLEGFGTSLSTYKLRKFVEKNNFSLIHLHNIHGYILDFSFINFLKKKKIPVIWTLHDGWSLTGSCAYLSQCNYWKNGCGNCPDKSLYPKTYVDLSSIMWKRKKSFFARGWKPVIVTPAKWLADAVKESYLKEHRIEVINNGVNTETFRPRNKAKIREELNIPENKGIILLVAADLDDERKGIKYFFDALKYINISDYMVITIGNKFKNEFNIDIRIKQLGYIYDCELLSKIYSVADIFCITSLDDNFPTTVLESLACGTPVVGFDVGGIPEQVADNCGFIVPPKDTKALASKLEELLIDDNLRKEYSNNCRERVVSKYSVDKMSENYIKLYKEILGEEQL